MCKKEIKDLLDLSRLSAITDEQRALVVEACLGYYILNEPPAELVRVVRAVSQKFIAYIEQHGIDALATVHYIVSTEGKYYGLLDEPPSGDAQGAREQILRALASPSIAVQLNVHRTLVKVVAGMSKHYVRSGPTNRNRKPIGDGVPTDRYGAVGRLGGVELTPTTQVHVPASTQVTTEGPPHPYDLPAVSGKSGTTEVLLKVAGALELSPPDQRWYCLGILGFLLAPGAHSLHEVAVTVQANAIALYTPCYRYCGFLGFEMQQAGWYRPMLAAFGSAMRFGYWGELERLCYELASNLPLSVEILSMVFTFLELPFLPPDQWSSWLQEKRRQKLEK